MEPNNNVEKETSDYMFAINKFLRHKNGGIIAEEWIGALKILEDNYDLFVKCSKQIEEEGLTINDRFGNLQKHPLLKVKTDAQIQVIKLINEFGLSLKSNQKITTDVEEEDNSPLAIFTKKNLIEKR